MLCLSSRDHIIQVGNHYPTHAAYRVQGDATPDAAITGSLTASPLGNGLITITRANVANCGAPATLTLTLPEFIGAGVAAGKAGHSLSHDRFRC